MKKSNVYVVAIRLETDNGELPTDKEVERLIAHQMSGELDETTGLRASNTRLYGGIWEKP